MRRLHHPNIVGYKDSFLTPRKDHLCIVMEYCDGGDLSTQIKNARYSSVGYPPSDGNHPADILVHLLHETPRYSSLVTLRSFIVGVVKIQRKTPGRPDLAIKMDLWDLIDVFPHTHSATTCLLYTSPSPRDGLLSRMPSSA